MRISVDEQRCCQSGMCVMTAPEVFELPGPGGSVLVLLPEPPADLHEAVFDAVDSCPTRAIRAD
jgi:ferredoxin